MMESSSHEPILEDHLLGLSARTKALIGGPMFVGGAIAVVRLWELGLIVGLSIVVMVMGGLLAWTGRQELARERAIESEVERATGEWEELRRAIEAAERGGASVTRMLQQRGYREFGVRRWIIRELSAKPEEE